PQADYHPRRQRIMDRAGAQSPSTDSYSPQRRTALVLTGTGTAGAPPTPPPRAPPPTRADNATAPGPAARSGGAARAAGEAGTPRFWEAKGFWWSPPVRALYRWRLLPRLLVLALIVSVLIVAVPIAFVALGLVTFPIDFVLKMVGVGGAGGLVAAYLHAAQK